MTELADWLRDQMHTRGLNQAQAALQAGVSPGTINVLLTRNHVPRVQTLNRLADAFRTPREQVLRLAGHLPPGPDQPAAQDLLTAELLREFLRVPDPWKEEALSQVRMFVRLSNLPPYRLIGDEPDEPPPATEPEEQDDETAAHAA